MWFLKRLWEFTLQFSMFYNGPDQISLGSIRAGRLSTDVQTSIKETVLDKVCVNSPRTRGCWSGSFNINTDYERLVPDGHLRPYDLVISNQPVAPDGYLASGMIINGSYPGPTLEGNWGDTFRITVHNNLTNNNGSSIHWHGIRQLNTNWQDGVAGVTQCPIPPGQSYTYEFRAMQYGTTWYHSHFSLQYPDGIAGPLKINGPTSMNYDIDLGPALISDWYHADAFSLYDQELNGNPPIPDSNILNGRGNYTCSRSDPRCIGKSSRTVFNVTAGQTYKLSLVNTATTTHFTFWIDGHNFSVVSTDFVPIKPYDTDTINVAIGQRYDIIFTANASTVKGSNFWIHARDCLNDTQYSPLGIIRYDSTSTLDPFTPPGNRVGYGCLDEPNPKPGPAFVPIVRRQVGRPQNPDPFGQDEALDVGLQGYPNTSDINSRLVKWILANSSLYLDWEVPSLSLISLYGGERSDKKFPPSYAPIVLDYPDDEWVYFLIQADFTAATNPRVEFIRPAAAAHPIHLHGHDFVILGQGNSSFDAGTFAPNLNNPPRRDVAMLPLNGHLVIGFQMGNPGAWLMHCHIAWHASSGLALQYIEQPGKIRPLIERARGVLPAFRDNCVDWSLYYNLVSEPNNATQADSGI